MRNEVGESWEWADGHAEAVVAVLEQIAGRQLSVRLATREEDRQEATDLVLLDGVEVAVRVRKADCKHRDLTIRSSRLSGVETELAKLRKGGPRWYFYGWEGDRHTLADWILVDMDVLRRKGLLDVDRPEIPNSDRRSCFVAIPLLELEQAGAIRAMSSKGRSV